MNLVPGLLLCTAVATAQTQTAEPPPSKPPVEPAPAAPPPEAPPTLRRWLDVQQLQLSSRYRYVLSSTGRITSSAHQWQPQLRARVLFDNAARYALHIGAFSGSHFVSGWNNTGGGLGEFAGDFNIKQLFAAVQLTPALEVQAGGLYVLRGESSEITAYDNDAFVMGERVTWRTDEGRNDKGRLTQVALTTGYIGDYRTPNVFARLDRLDDWNYAQLLGVLRVAESLSASVDYTYEDGRDILRQGVLWHVPQRFSPLISLRGDVYERWSEDSDVGAHVGAELRPLRAFTVAAGLAHVDEGAFAPDFMSLNGDRYERGTRFYTQGSYALTPDLAIGWFQTKAFSTDYVIPNEQRWEVVLTLNPLATLKARKIF